MEILNASDTIECTVFDQHGNRLPAAAPLFSDAVELKGVYYAKCFDKDGNLLWEDEARNTVVTSGKNLLLNTFMSGSSYTVTGPYMGLISSVSFTAISATDTMSSHSGWTEAGGTNAPTYSGTRPTAAFASASGGSIALSANLSFSITGSGTIKGCFIVLGSGAVATIDNTAGTLFSAGLFSGGDQSVVNTNVVQVSYSLSV